MSVATSLKCSDNVAALWGGVFLPQRMACGYLLGDKERFTMQQQNQSVFTLLILSSSDVITSP